MYELDKWYWVRLEHGSKDLPARRTCHSSHFSNSTLDVVGWVVEGAWHWNEDVDQVISQIPTASHYAQMVTILRQLGAYGEALWDETNFKYGNKKIPSGLLVRARKLLNSMGYNPEPEEYFPDL